MSVSSCQLWQGAMGLVPWEKLVRTTETSSWEFHRIRKVLNGSLVWITNKETHESFVLLCFCSALPEFQSGDSISSLAPLPSAHSFHVWTWTASPAPKHWNVCTLISSTFFFLEMRKLWSRGQKQLAQGHILVGLDHLGLNSELFPLHRGRCPKLLVWGDAL